MYVRAPDMSPQTMAMKHSADGSSIRSMPELDSVLRQRLQISPCVRAAGGIELVAAPPGPWCGWRAESSSYFDRLWRTGISAHSAAHERFVLHVARAT